MTDVNPDDLDGARESVDALAQHVDTAAAWNDFVAADAGPRRVRNRRGVQLAAALVTVVALVGAVAFAVSSRSSNNSTVRIKPASPPTSTLASCTLPKLPVAKVDGGEGQLGGPAVAALRGGAASAPLDLDDGLLTMTPPEPGVVPAVTANQAECAALASISGDSRQLLYLALEYGGAVVGYGRVTVAPRLIAAASPPWYAKADSDQDTSPTLPKPTPYQNRLAWLVVVRSVLIFHGPLQTVPSSTTTVTSPPAPPSNGYLVFLVDANTGSDALLYAEGQPNEPPSVIAPAELVSVPWTLVSRSPNGYSGTIRATVLPCDGYPNPVAVDRDSNGANLPSAKVVVRRPVSPDCGPAKEVTVPLLAATVTSNLPAEIAHDPLGPAVAVPRESTSGPAPTDTTAIGTLRQVGDQDNGHTVEIKVGDVLAIAPLMDVDHDAPSAVVSSDPAVLGLLIPGTQSPVGEFRAWRAGHADLSVPTSACHYPKSGGLPCTGAWIVHIDIT